MKAKVFWGEASSIENQMESWAKKDNPQKIIWASQSSVPQQITTAQSAGKESHGTIPIVTITILYE